MPVFSYIARTAAGTLEKGSITAPSPESARERLRKQQLLVEELKEEKTGNTTGFASGMPWTTTDNDMPNPDPIVDKLMKQAHIHADYMPLVDTLRLFAGWLLAWYSLVYLLGSFRMDGKLPFEVPFLQGLFESTLVLRFAFSTFLFLLLTTVHAALGKGVSKGVGLAALGLVIFAAFYWLA